MTKWPVRDGSPDDDGGEAFLNACVEELMGDGRKLADAQSGDVYAYDCVCGRDVGAWEVESHAAECDKLAEFVRASE
jgi:hypothetical protein